MLYSINEIKKRLGSSYDEAKLRAYLAAVGMAEGGGSRTQRQVSGTKGNFYGGPGRGLYQIEPATASTLSSRYNKLLTAVGKKEPRWFTRWKSTNTLNASNLGKAEQSDLLLAGMLGSTRDWAKFEEYMNGSRTAGELAADVHKRVFRGKNAKADEANYIAKIDGYYDKYLSDSTMVTNILDNNDWVSGKHSGNYDDNDALFVSESTDTTPAPEPGPSEAQEAERIENEAAEGTFSNSPYIQYAPDESNYFKGGLRTGYNR